MAEYFNNYLTKRSFNKNQYQIIVPVAGTDLSVNGTADNNNYVSGTRPSNATSQIHSIYITKHVTSNYTNDDPLSQAAVVSLSIVDTGNDNREFYIANNVMVLPHSSFYVEKAITLLPQQYLKLTYSNISPNTNGVSISTVCSSVDITD